VVAHVRLVQSSTVPSLKGRFLRVKVDGDLPKCGGDSGPPVLFEPESEVLTSTGLVLPESLVTVDDTGCTLVPVQNCEGVCVHLEEEMKIGTVRHVGKVKDVVDFVDGVSACGLSAIGDDVVLSEDQFREREQCGSVGVVVQTPGRMERLIEELTLSLDKLSEDQSQ